MEHLSSSPTTTVVMNLACGWASRSSRNWAAISRYSAGSRRWARAVRRGRPGRSARGVRGDLASPFVLLLKLGEHALERRDDGRVELDPGVAVELGQGVVVAQGPAVGAPERHGIVGVGHAHRSRDQRDRLSGETVGIPGAVPVLVMVAHAQHEVFGKQRSQDVREKIGC